MTTSVPFDSQLPPDLHTTAMCSATTHAGLPCRFAARHHSGLCVNHDPGFREQQAANRAHGSQASKARRAAIAAARRTSPLPALDPWVLADRSSIQALLDAVIRLELAGQLPKERTRNLLRALALAARNFDRPVRMPDNSSRARHNLDRYRKVRTTVDQYLEALFANAPDAATQRPTATNTPDAGR